MNDIERLRRIHRDDERIDPIDYANLVRQAFRSAPTVASELLQETYEKGLQEAYASRSRGALAMVALMGAEQLNAVGDHDGAIARLNQALQMTPDDPESRARILGMRAAWEAMSADPGAATATLAAAREALPGDSSAETALGVDQDAALVWMILLSARGLDAATDVIGRARAKEIDWIASATMVYVVQVLASGVETNEAIAWADSLHGYASSLHHAAREADARIAQLALRARRGLVEVPLGLEASARDTLNIVALWRLQVLKLYLGVTRGSRDQAVRAVEGLEETRSEINPGFTASSGGFGAYVAAHFGSRTAVQLAAPETPTLLMLGGALASAEAVAVTGSQSLAADWLRWLELSLPPAVATSPEWPTCRRRVEGLLLLRLGREREAVTRLQDAIACCEERRDDVQAAIGRVQLSEALLRGSTASMVPAEHARALRESGSDELRRLGVDPIPFAYAASRTFLDEDRKPERGGLTPREAQVLGRLAQGLSYAEIGDELGINPRTVGVHATHCYEKLGVRNRVEAVRLAGELGIV